MNEAVKLLQILTKLKGGRIYFFRQKKKGDGFIF